jgi:hypothetical protein
MISLHEFEISMFHRILLRFAALVLVGAALPAAHAAAPFRYSEAKHGKGELKYIEGIPVVVVEGTPAEMGEQLGALAFKPAAPLMEIADEFIARHGWEQAYATVLKTGNLFLPRFPPHHAEELEAAAKAAGCPREMLIFANVIGDLRRVIGCSTFIVEPDKSATGGPLFGRNLDWPPFGPLHEYTFVTVYRPTGKRAFASVTYPGVLGCASGINDAGLAVAALDAPPSKDGSAGFNPLGMPAILALRRVLEECATVDEATELLRSVDRASSLNVAVCDKDRVVILEVTPKQVVVRQPSDGVCICTNHFRTDEFGGPESCWRYERLAASAVLEQYAIADVAERMHSVNQGASTLQTMIFEPRAQKLHLAFGQGPATALPLNTLDLEELFWSDSGS